MDFGFSPGESYWAGEDISFTPFGFIRWPGSPWLGWEPLLSAPIHRANERIWRPWRIPSRPRGSRSRRFSAESKVEPVSAENGPAAGPNFRFLLDTVRALMEEQQVMTGSVHSLRDIMREWTSSIEKVSRINKSLVQLN